MPAPASPPRSSPGTTGSTARSLRPTRELIAEAEGLFILPRWAREAIDAARRPTTFE